MQESAQAALSYVRSRGEFLALAASWLAISINRLPRKILVQYFHLVKPI